ncbi:DUF6528 family protein [Paenibacillus solisilvae]|uniref:DUF6528 family protein n=1 Tax=Paenibacillus solisilvae TaxID=2486751 RepID=A0ABW0VV56_9BACL
MEAKDYAEPAKSKVVADKREADAVSRSSGEAGRYIAATDQASHAILVLDPAAADWNDEHAVIWRWSPEESNGFRGLTAAWGLPTEAKIRPCAVWGGLWLVTTDSLGLVAIIPYPEGGSRKWGRNVGGNPHSAELLPGGNLAVAASTGGWVRVYASSQGPDSGVYAEYAMPGAHGVVWDSRMNLLWTVGNDHVAALRVGGSDAAPELREMNLYRLPTRHGHDLQPVSGDPGRLWVSTGAAVISSRSRRGFSTRTTRERR